MVDLKSSLPVMPAAGLVLIPSGLCDVISSSVIKSGVFLGIIVLSLVSRVRDLLIARGEADGCRNSLNTILASLVFVARWH